LIILFGLSLRRFIYRSVGGPDPHHRTGADSRVAFIFTAESRWCIRNTIAIRVVCCRAVAVKLSR